MNISFGLSVHNIYMKYSEDKYTNDLLSPGQIMYFLVKINVFCLLEHFHEMFYGA